MKREGIFNEPILKVMGSMGHTDKLVLCDAGLPIPKGVEKNSPYANVILQTGVNF